MSAYLVFHNRITDAAKMEEYTPKALETMAPYKPEVVVLDENSVVIEGSSDLPRTVIVKFKSRDDALSWYKSEEYSKVRPLRLEATEGFCVLVDQFEA